MRLISEALGHSMRTRQMKAKSRGDRLWQRISRLLLAGAFTGSLMCAHPNAQQGGDDLQTAG